MPINDILLHPKREMVEHRFNSRVDRREPDECWPWTGELEPAGYAFFYGQKIIDRAHRWAYVFAKGPIGRYSENRSLCVCHTCDNRACCNPAHLFEGTDADNAADMARKGRVQRGSKHYAAKLTEEQVLAIRLDTRPYREIAADYGVGTGTIGNLFKKGSWPGLPFVVADRTAQRGAANHSAKLTEDAVRAIRRDPRTLDEIAKTHGVDRRNIYYVKIRATWSHLPPHPDDVPAARGTRGRPRVTPGEPVRPQGRLGQLRRAVEQLQAQRQPVEGGWFVPVEAMQRLDEKL